MIAHRRRRSAWGWRLGAIIIATLLRIPSVALFSLASRRRSRHLVASSGDRAAFLSPDHRSSPRRRRRPDLPHRHRHRLARHHLPISLRRVHASGPSSCRWPCRPTSSPTPMCSSWNMPARCRPRCGDASAGTSPHDYSFPEIRSLPGAILVMSLVLYPYVYASARASFLASPPPRSTSRAPWAAPPLAPFLTVGLPLARPAHRRGLEPCAARMPERHRRRRVLRRQDHGARHLHDLARPGRPPARRRSPCVMLGFVRRPDRPGALARRGQVRHGASRQSARPPTPARLTGGQAGAGAPDLRRAAAAWLHSSCGDASADVCAATSDAVRRRNSPCRGDQLAAAALAAALASLIALFIAYCGRTPDAAPGARAGDAGRPRLCLSGNHPGARPAHSAGGARQRSIGGLHLHRHRLR